MYSNRLIVKYKSLIKRIYDHLIIKALKQLRLTVEEAKVSDLNFSRHVQECYRKKDTVQCCSCDYLIHNNISCNNII